MVEGKKKKKPCFQGNQEEADSAQCFWLQGWSPFAVSTLQNAESQITQQPQTDVNACRETKHA